MSDYTQSTFFAPKDLLATGNPNKIIYGSDVDAELSAISTAIATKADVNGDAIGAGTPCTELSVDNLKLDGNKIISTNTDGDIELEPDGTGSVVITKVDIADGEIDGTPIGANSASTGAFTTLTASGDVNFDSGTLFVDASANAVGIGTASPACQLDVTGLSAEIRVNSSADNGGRIAWDNSSGVFKVGSFGAANYNIVFDQNGSERARIDTSGNALIGTTAVTGSLSNAARVTGGIFSTNNGTTSVPNATWTTLTAIPTGDAVYLVTAYLPNSGDPAGYNAVSIVTTSLTGTNLVDIKNANQVALRMSGSNFQVNHGQGTTQPINWSILRLA